MPTIKSNELPELAVHSHGIGQESSAIHEMWSDRNFRQRYGGKTIIIVTSDTGDEKPETTQYRIEVLEPRLRKLGLPYHFISTTAGFQARGQTVDSFINSRRMARSARSRLRHHAARRSRSPRFTNSWSITLSSTTDLRPATSAA
jgi:hypothetical protein